MLVLVRVFLVLVGLAALALAAGFLFDQSWATRFWPFFSYFFGKLFIASILAAIGAPIIWLGITGEFAGIAGGAINLAIGAGGMAMYAFSLANGSDSIPLKIFAVGCAVAWFIQVVLFLVTYRLSFRDQRRTPFHVRVAFALFAAALVLSGSALVAQVPNVFPWNLSADLSVLYGCIFLGNAAYFTYGLLRPVAGNAQGQLIAFLAYDLVLLGPFVAMVPTVADAFRPSLFVYIAVLIGSGALAVYSLAFDPALRLSGRDVAAPPRQAAVRP